MGSHLEGEAHHSEESKAAGAGGSWSQCISSQEAEAAGRMLVPKSNFPLSTQAHAHRSTHVEVREQVCGGGSPATM